MTVHNVNMQPLCPGLLYAMDRTGEIIRPRRKQRRRDDDVSSLHYFVNKIQVQSDESGSYPFLFPDYRDLHGTLARARGIKVDEVDETEVA